MPTGIFLHLMTTWKKNVDISEFLTKTKLSEKKKKIVAQSCEKILENNYLL